MTFTRSPCAGIAQQTSLGNINHLSAEVEPYVVADPADSQHLVVVFQQDRWNDGGDNRTITDVSENGGKSWTLATSMYPGVCPGGT